MMFYQPKEKYRPVTRIYYILWLAAVFAGGYLFAYLFRYIDNSFPTISNFLDQPVQGATQWLFMFFVFLPTMLTVLWLLILFCLFVFLYFISAFHWSRKYDLNFLVEALGYAEEYGRDTTYVNFVVDVNKLEKMGWAQKYNNWFGKNQLNMIKAAYKHWRKA